MPCSNGYCSTHEREKRAGVAGVWRRGGPLDRRAVQPKDRDRDLLHGRMVHGVAPEAVLAERLAVVAAEDDDRVRGKCLEEPREPRVEELDRLDLVSVRLGVASDGTRL